MLILGLDPGPTNTGWALYCNDDGPPTVRDSGSRENLSIMSMLQFLSREHGNRARLAIEMISSYGMPVGKETFETCVWIGRYQQAWHAPNAVSLIPRREVKEYLCAGNPKAGDSNVRVAIIDMFPPTGGGKTKQIGTKDQPGPLHGVATHAWAALGVALCYAYRQQVRLPPRIQMSAPVRLDAPLDENGNEFVEYKLKTTNGQVLQQARYVADLSGVATATPNPDFIEGEQS